MIKIQDTQYDTASVLNNHSDVMLQPYWAKTKISTF